MSYSILKMRRENKTTPAHLNSAQQEYPTASVPLHQIPLQQTIPCNQQQLQSQSPPPIHQQSTPVNQQQQPSLQQQQYGAQQLSTESLIKQQQSSIQQWPYHPQQSQTQEQHSQIQQQSSTQQWPTQQQENLTQQMSSTQQWPAQQQSSTQQWPVQQHSSTQPWQAQTQLTPTLKKQPQAQNKQNPAQQQQLADTQQSILNQQQHPELATQQSRIEDTSISGLFRDAMDTVNDYSYDDLEFTDMSSSTPTHIPRGNIHQRSSAETPQRVSNCHSCCKKVEFLTKELVELRRQVMHTYTLLSFNGFSSLICTITSGTSVLDNWS